MYLLGKSEPKRFERFKIKMGRKKYFLFNPVWIGAIAMVVILIALFFDLTVADGKRWVPRTGPMGFAISISVWVILDIGYSWAFLRKLAWKYPARKKEILALRKLYVIPDKWCFQKRDKKILESHHPLAAFSDGSEEFAQIEREWRAAYKWMGIFAILMCCLLAMELLFWDRLDAVRPIVQDYLRSIGL